MSSEPTKIQGKVILLATVCIPDFFERDELIATLQLYAQPGKADLLQKHLMDIHQFANSASEPGCLTFRVSRFEDKFIVFEEYVNPPRPALLYPNELVIRIAI